MQQSMLRQIGDLKRNTPAPGSTASAAELERALRDNRDMSERLRKAERDLDDARRRQSVSGGSGGARVQELQEENDRLTQENRVRRSPIGVVTGEGGSCAQELRDELTRLLATRNAVSEVSDSGA